MFQRNLLATLRAARRWEEAIAVQGRIVALLAGDLEAQFDLHYLKYLADGSRGAVEEFFTGLAPAERESPLGLNLRLQWARATGEWAEAIRLDELQPYYDGAGEPRWRQAYMSALDRWMAGDPVGARSRLGNFRGEVQELLEREPTNLAALSVLAGMEIILGHHDEARRLMRKTEEILPESRDALDGVIYAALRATWNDHLGRKDEALAEYARLLRTPSVGLLNVHGLRHRAGSLRGDPRWEALLNDPKNNAPLF